MPRISRNDVVGRNIALGLISLTLSLATLVAAPVAAQEESCADPQATGPGRKPDLDGRTSLFDVFIQPLAQESALRRAQWTANDPYYAHRIDQSLNAHRLNVALLGYGEEHDQSYADTGVSITILSLDLNTWDLASISLSRDIRAPELEDQSAHEPPRWPMTLRGTYKALGFAGVRTVLEDATGLVIDFQVLIRDVLLKDYLDTVSGPVDIVVPKEFSTNVYHLGGVEHATDYIPAGRQRLSTDQAMTFVLGESLDPQGKADERSYRKELLLKTLSCQARQRLGARDAGFTLGLARFALDELNRDDLQSDFDIGLLTGSLASMSQALVTSRGQVDASFPQLGNSRELVIHDEAFGDGGVRRVHHMASIPDDQGQPDDDSVKAEIAMGSLAPYMLVPISGNPYAADVVNDYWRSVRALISTTLMQSR
jgi:anionic cell wall polymer biosynthesis LytR-Cps2A-Psr (LCP) family protein